MLEVTSNRPYNNCMLNEIDHTNRAIDFVVQVSEMIAGYNERMISYDLDKLMDEAYANKYNDMTKEDLPFALDIFEEDFGDPDAGWLNWECVAIREWIENKALGSE